MAVKNPGALLAAVAQQPVSVAVAATTSTFVYYRGGVISSTACGTSLNHGVTVIGYGTDSALGDYWLVKNSWGTWWGEKGYFRVKRDNNAGPGICGILLMPSYPTI